MSRSRFWQIFTGQALRPRPAAINIDPLDFSSQLVSLQESLHFERASPLEDLEAASQPAALAGGEKRA
jgi:hypothetical protein